MKLGTLSAHTAQHRGEATPPPTPLETLLGDAEAIARARSQVEALLVTPPEYTISTEKMTAHPSLLPFAPSRLARTTPPRRSGTVVAGAVLALSAACGLAVREARSLREAATAAAEGERQGAPGVAFGDAARLAMGRGVRAEAAVPVESLPDAPRWPPFDAAAALQSLEQAVRAAGCGSSEGETFVEVRFDLSGGVDTVSAEGPGPAGPGVSCAMEALRTAVVAPFEGPSAPVVVRLATGR